MIMKWYFIIKFNKIENKMQFYYHFNIIMLQKYKIMLSYHHIFSKYYHLNSILLWNVCILAAIVHILSAYLQMGGHY